MEAIYSICCGVDVHKKILVACLRRGKRHETRQFGTTTDELLGLSTWLMNEYRVSLVCTRTAELNRLQKMLEGGNIKLSGTISNILGMSGRRLLDGLLAGRKFTKEDIEEMFEDGTA